VRLKQVMNLCQIQKRQIVLMVYNQNTRDLSNKTEELISFLSPNSPRVLCLTEHHLKDSEIYFTYIDQYKLGAKFCRKSFKTGGLSIFVHDTLQCTNINQMNFVMKKTLKHVQLGLIFILNYLNYIQLQITYWKFFAFLCTLDSILKFLHNTTIEIKICGDFNINYLNDNKKSKLDNLLLS
jgi:hypothetical protein